MSTDNVALRVVKPTEEEQAGAFFVPKDEPYMRRVVGKSEGNVVCGKCLRVVGEGVTLLAFWSHFSMPEGKRQLMLCTCGSFLLMPSHPGPGPQPWGEALKAGTFGRAGKRKAPRQA